MEKSFQSKLLVSLIDILSFFTFHFFDLFHEVYSDPVRTKCKYIVNFMDKIASM